MRTVSGRNNHTGITYFGKVWQVLASSCKAEHSHSCILQPTSKETLEFVPRATGLFTVALLKVEKHVEIIHCSMAR